MVMLWEIQQRSQRIANREPRHGDEVLVMAPEFAHPGFHADLRDLQIENAMAADVEGDSQIGDVFSGLRSGRENSCTCRQEAGEKCTCFVGMGRTASRCRMRGNGPKFGDARKREAPATLVLRGAFDGGAGAAMFRIPGMVRVDQDVRV